MTCMNCLRQFPSATFGHHCSICTEGKTLSQEVREQMMEHENRITPKKDINSPSHKVDTTSGVFEVVDIVHKTDLAAGFGDWSSQSNLEKNRGGERIESTSGPDQLTTTPGATTVDQSSPVRPLLEPSQAATPGGRTPKRKRLPDEAKVAANWTEESKRSAVFEVTRDLVSPSYVAKKYGVTPGQVISVINSAGFQLPTKCLSSPMKPDAMNLIRKLAAANGRSVVMEQSRDLAKELKVKWTDIKVVLENCQAAATTLLPTQPQIASTNHASDEPKKDNAETREGGESGEDVAASLKRPHGEDRALMAPPPPPPAPRVVAPEIQQEFIKWHNQFCDFKLGEGDWGLFTMHFAAFHVHWQMDLSPSQKDLWTEWHDPECSFQLEDWTDHWDIFVIHLALDHPEKMPPPIFQ